MTLPESIQVNADPAKLLGAFFQKRSYTRILVLADENTATLCYPLVKAAIPDHDLIQTTAGEEHKTLETCRIVWEQMTTRGLDRHSALVVVGGGVLGDLGGFCAATFKRGIDFVLLPTTLLAQVDASVGGKLGIDFMSFKNHIGVFCEPASTLICPVFLKTLPDRELRSGFAEVIKHCLISDKAMWDMLKQKGHKDQNWQTLIPHSISFKASIVARDPRESGLRKVLNFGHTIGHALETYFLSSSNRLYHGEAIAAGMMAEADIAGRKQLLSPDEVTQIQTYLLSVYGRSPQADHQRVLDLMRQDKKNKGNRILMALPKGIGSAVWDVEVSEEMVREALQSLQPAAT